MAIFEAPPKLNHVIELYDFRRVHFLEAPARFAAPKLEGDPKIESHEIKATKQIDGQFCDED